MPRDKAKSLANKKKHGLENRQRLSQIKLERGCVDCGYNLHPAALDFDHVRGVKLFGIGSKFQKSWKVLLEEIAKCDVRCSNCHRIRTWGKVMERNLSI